MVLSSDGIFTETRTREFFEIGWNVATGANRGCGGTRDGHPLGKLEGMRMRFQGWRNSQGVP